MNARRRGTVLIVVMVVVFVVAAMVLTLGKQVRTQALVSANELSTQKADAAERGAEQFALSVLSDYRTSLPDLTESYFSAVPVGDAYFWIVRPTYNDTNTPAWGLVDESGKLDLNTATADQIALIPGMTTDLAAAIVAWRGTGTTPTATATDSGTSGTAAVTSSDGSTKNAAFESVEELMLMPGMTRELLYGQPALRAAAAANGTANGSTDDWYLAHGVFDYFTVWNSQPNTAADGTARVSYITADRTDLSNLLTSKLGDQTKSSEIIRRITTGNGPRARPMPLSGMFQFAQEAQLTTDDYVAIEDYVTRDSQATSISGLVGLNSAPREVLVALGKLADDDIDKLISARPDAITQYPTSTVWAFTALGSASLTLDGYVAAQGRQFSADIVAAAGNGRGWKRVRVVIDTTSSPARIVYRRDLTDQGWPLDPQILEQLKAGTFVGGQASAQTTPTGAR